MASPNLASRRWIWEQYDSQVGADTLQRPGGDAAVVRVHGTKKALAMTTDCTPRYCYADPYEGGKQAVAEAYRNLCAVGAKPLAITNCLNFGNPQRPEIMAPDRRLPRRHGRSLPRARLPDRERQRLASTTRARRPAAASRSCRPRRSAASACSTIGRRSATIAFKAEGEHVILIGHSDSHVGQSLWLDVFHGRREGAPPPVDLAAERRAGECVRELIARGLVTAVHDFSDGGAAVAVAEMALAGEHRHAMTVVEQIPNPAAILFGEDQGRYVVTTRDPDAVRALANAAQLFAVPIGTTGGDALTFDLVDRGGSQSSPSPTSAPRTKASSRS